MLYVNKKQTPDIPIFVKNKYNICLIIYTKHNMNWLIFILHIINLSQSMWLEKTTYITLKKLYYL